MHTTSKLCIVSLDLSLSLVVVSLYHKKSSALFEFYCESLKGVRDFLFYHVRSNIKQINLEIE